MGMLIFAGLAYALEKDEPDTMFYTLPQTLYWAIITMTSTGTVLYSTVQYSTVEYSTVQYSTVQCAGDAGGLHPPGAAGRGGWGSHHRHQLARHKIIPGHCKISRCFSTTMKIFI